jgi:hypothetical protein
MSRVLLPALAGVALIAACGASPVSPTPVDSPDVPDPNQQGCARTSVGLTPLPDLTDTYRDEPGGLYAGAGASIAAHLADGAAVARAIGPRDAAGTPSASGRYGFVSIGMSNTTQEFRAFMTLADADPLRDPALVIADGAQGGQTAADWASPSCNCWSVLDRRVSDAGLTARQIAVAWVKLADRQPSGEWPAYARTLQAETGVVLQRLKARFPNLALAYLTSRIYAGYATTTLNPEPYAYHSAFSVRWTIEEQMTGSGGLRYDGPGAPAPWIGWGPYLWADGMRARSDGLSWSCGDFQADGTHPSASGRQKVAERLLQFLQSDATAREWYVRD